MGISDIKEEFKTINYDNPASVELFIDKYKDDSRSGVISIVNSAKKKLDAINN